MGTTPEPQDTALIGKTGFRVMGLGLGAIALWLILGSVSGDPVLTPHHSLWSLPAGLTVALLLDYGWRALPLPILAGLVAAGLSIGPWEHWPYSLTFINVMTSLGYLGVASLLRRYPIGQCQPSYFSNAQQLTWFFTVTATGSLLMVLVSIAILNIAGALPQPLAFSHLLLRGWLDNFLGIIIVTPLMLTVLIPLARRTYKGEPLFRALTGLLKGPLSAPMIVLQSLLAAFLLVIFFGAPLHFPHPWSESLNTLLLSLLLLPALVWTVTSHGIRGTVLTVFLFEVGIVTGVSLLGQPESTIYYQMVMVSIAISGLLTGALFHKKLAHSAVFHDLVEMSSDLLWSCDARGRLDHLQGSLIKAMQPEARLVGMNWCELVSSQAHDSDLEIMKAAIQQQRPFRQLALCVQLPGQPSPIWTSNSGLPMFGEDGEWTGYRGITTDISAYKKAEALLRTYHQNLEANIEAKVEERTRTLAEASVRNWRLANYDSLTKLPNRNLLFEHLRKALQQARRQWKLLAILLVDLDGFKSVNDTYGHDAGDDLLQQLGARLQQCVRASDTAARLGGDEFVVVLSGIGPAETVTVAQKIISRLAEPVVLNATTVVVTASVGIALYRPELAASLETMMSLLRQADSAMYAAKRAGKNNWQFAELTKAGADVSG